MRREDLIAFARRDWNAVAEMKERFWVEQKKQMTAGEALRLADDLRRAVINRRHDWPSEDDRQSDLATHTRVSESLQRVPSTKFR
ncbi:MAG: hypothetical protein M3P29_12695 [Acidobacteriota bacterium]|nr:hypothetical protein [Acidobacteriota bacterium]